MADAITIYKKTALNIEEGLNPRCFTVPNKEPELSKDAVEFKIAADIKLKVQQK